MKPKTPKSRDNFAPSQSIDRRRWDNIFKDTDDSLLHDPNRTGCDNILKDQVVKIELYGYKLVYQGGHHNVYCNEKLHYKTCGGYAGKHKFDGVVSETFKCDCEKWK